FFATPEKRGGHRALADIAESIQELAYFRQAVLIAGPGPKKPEAEAIAAAAREKYAALVDGES
ncbi:MAG: oligoribonuclease, partial [Actinobacteria bacterium]|nr:oligoribonuclease [Actinomycetota bacterium]